MSLVGQRHLGVLISEKHGVGINGFSPHIGCRVRQKGDRNVEMYLYESVSIAVRIYVRAMNHMVLFLLTKPRSILSRTFCLLLGRQTYMC
jgi:hypothetical protein